MALMLPLLWCINACCACILDCNSTAAHHLLSVTDCIPTADTIPLQAQQTAPRTVVLQWGSGGGETIVYRQYPDSEDATAIATVVGNTFTDRHGRAVCGDTVRYSIRCGDDVGFAAVNVVDDAPTQPAQWGVVTVDVASQQIMLQWEPSPDTDIMGYLICEGSPSIAIDTVYGRESHDYRFLNGDPTQAYLFRLCAFDSCRQASSLTETCNNIAMLLDAEPCSRDLTASWNAYRNMPSGLGAYELWVSEDNGPFRHIISTGQEEVSASFSVSDQCQRVSAYVKALSTDSSLQAFSNIVVYVFGTAERPDYLYLRKVSVSDDGAVVTLLGQTDPAFSGDYKVYRSSGAGGSSAVVGHCSPAADGTLLWSDNTARTQDQQYTYWFAVMDGCDRNEIKSQKANTIVPVVEANGSNVTVTWNPYRGWDGTTAYDLLSAPVGSDNWHLVASGADTVQNDVLDGVVGQLRYKVVAAEGGNSSHRHYDTVQSVTVFYRPQTTIWMPNAFTPDEGSNNFVLPRASYINPDGYSFIIYNRMGQMVFSTDDTSEPWDGSYKGIRQPAGAYTYIINFRQNDGTSQRLTGTVILIR